MSAPREQAIAIVTDDPGWHGREIRDAFARAGRASHFLSLTQVGLDLSKASGHLEFPGFSGLPAGVFVRGIPGGSLEQVTLRLGVLHLLMRMGIQVYNDAPAIERTVDKSMTSALLRLAGIPTPATWVSESLQQLYDLVGRSLPTSGPVVVKPLFGSQGNGLRLLPSIEHLDSLEDLGGVAYVQEYLNPGASEWQDMRVLVIGGRARAAMRRRSRHWVTNRARGGVCEPLALDASLAALAEAATRAVAIDYAGVDLMQDRHGHLQVIEVNSIPAWKGLQDVSDLCIAQALVEHFISKQSDNVPQCDDEPMPAA